MLYFIIFVIKKYRTCLEVTQLYYTSDQCPILILYIIHNIFFSNNVFFFSKWGIGRITLEMEVAGKKPEMGTRRRHFSGREGGFRVWALVHYKSQCLVYHRSRPLTATPAASPFTLTANTTHTRRLLHSWTRNSTTGYCCFSSSPWRPWHPSPFSDDIYKLGSWLVCVVLVRAKSCRSGWHAAVPCSVDSSWPTHYYYYKENSFFRRETSY